MIFESTKPEVLVLDSTISTALERFVYVYEADGDKASEPQVDTPVNTNNSDNNSDNKDNNTNNTDNADANNDNNNSDKKNDNPEDKGFIRKILDGIKEFFKGIITKLSGLFKDRNTIKLPPQITITKIEKDENGNIVSSPKAEKILLYSILLIEHYNKLDEIVKEYENLFSIIQQVHSTPDGNTLDEPNNKYAESEKKHEEYNNFLKTEVPKSIKEDNTYIVNTAPMINNYFNIKQKYSEITTKYTNVNVSSYLSNGAELTEKDKLLKNIFQLGVNYSKFILGVIMAVNDIIRAHMKANGTDNTDLINGEIDRNILGFNCVKITNNRFPFAKQTTDPKLKAKFGDYFIVYDPQILSILDSETQQFVLYHEAGHCTAYKDGSDNKTKGTEKEAHADMFAMKHMNLSVDNLDRIYDALVRASAKTGENEAEVRSQTDARKAFIVDYMKKNSQNDQNNNGNNNESNNEEKTAAILKPSNFVNNKKRPNVVRLQPNVVNNNIRKNQQNNLINNTQNNNAFSNNQNNKPVTQPIYRKGRVPAPTGYTNANKVSIKI